MIPDLSHTICVRVRRLGMMTQPMQSSILHSARTDRMDSSELASALINARSVIETSPYDAIEAARAVQRLAALAPPHVKPIALKAGRAVATSIEQPYPVYDTIACHALRQLVVAMERSYLRVVK